MLIEFNVSNFLSFSEEKTFSMVSANSVKEHKDTNVFFNEFSNLSLLKSAAIYGDNASGKSNFLNAFGFMKYCILLSFKNALENNDNKVMYNNKFRLNELYDNKPSTFEIIFLINEKRYRYGFEMLNNEFSEEWLFCVKRKKEIKLFHREKSGIYYNKREFIEGKDRLDKTKNNVLCLSVLAHLNGKISNEVVTWFDKVKTLSSISRPEEIDFQGYTIEKMEKDEIFYNWTKGMISFLGISDITIKKFDFDKVVNENIDDEKLKQIIDIIKTMDVKKREPKTLITWHSKKCKDKEILVPFDLREESSGTRKFIGLLGPIYDTLKKGNILLIDELDSRLHTLLTRKIVDIFHKYNKNNAQLIFASHDTNLLIKDIFRRDQIWFTEKNIEGATDLYSLVEYKNIKPRKDASYNKEYLSGKYGSIPFLSNMNELLDFIYG